MRKIHLLLIYFALILALSAACGKGKDAVSTDGSTSMERVMSALIEGYRATDSTVIVNYSGTGSGAGIESVLSGICDIGLSSRPLSESEIRKGATAHLVALDGIAVIVNASNPVINLTKAQLAQIFTGEITDWSQLGSKQAPIAVYGREAGSGTRSAFEESADITGRAHYTNEYNSGGDIVSSISLNPNGIGYVSLAHVKGNVRPLSIDGTVCSEETIRSGQYTIQRPFLFVTDRRKPLAPQTQAFLDYATGDAVSEYIAIAGAIAP